MLCNRCGEDKDADCFYYRSNGRVQSGCKDCRRIYRKQHYEENKAYYLAKNTKAKRLRRERYRALKDGPCTDCGNRYPYYQMTWDHLRDKKFNIGEGMRMGMPRVLEEIKKCELVCLMCHAERTHQRHLVNMNMYL